MTTTGSNWAQQIGCRWTSDPAGEDAGLRADAKHDNAAACGRSQVARQAEALVDGRRESSAHVVVRTSVVFEGCCGFCAGAPATERMRAGSQHTRMGQGTLSGPASCSATNQVAICRLAGVQHSLAANVQEKGSLCAGEMQRRG
jgi:acyl-coenzyme A thioesterase PaaI-like protein